MPLFRPSVIASDTAAGDIEIAIQSEQETGTDVTRAVTPGRQHFHPSAAKTWSYVTGGGTPVQQTSFNMTSITDVGVGIITFTIATDFSTANWSGHVLAATTCANAATFGVTCPDSDLTTAGVINALCFNLAATSVAIEAVNWAMVGLGDI